MEVTIAEKELCSIGAIDDHEDSKESKDIGKKYQASSIESKEKDSYDMESLAKYLKFLTNEVF